MVQCGQPSDRGRLKNRTETEVHLSNVCSVLAGLGLKVCETGVGLDG